MGKISKVYYEEIDPEVYSEKEAAEYYFFFNLIGVHDMFQDGYENNEMAQIKVRNNIIRHAIDNGFIPKDSKIRSTIFGVSPITRKPVLIAEY